MTEPVTLDRRLTVRVHTVWKKSAGAGFPRRAHIDPRDFGTDWAHCLMIDLDPVVARSRFAHVGAALRDPTWPTFDRQSVSECLEGTLLELLARHIPRVVAKRKPASFAGSAQHEDGEILYRTILLPLSENEDLVDGILAAIAYREVSVDDELRTPEHQADGMSAPPALLARPPRLGGASR
jgi:hypothetical protein